MDMNEKGGKKSKVSGPSDRKRAVMNKTKAIAIFVIIVGTLLYLKTEYYPSLPPWEEHHSAGLAASMKKDFPQVEVHFKAALKEAETFSPDDWRLTLTLGNLAENYRVQGKFAEAEPYLKQVLEIGEQVYGPDHPNVAAHLNNLAGNYRAQGKLAEAEPLYQRTLDIWENILGPEDPLVLFALKNYADLLREMGRDDDAKRAGARQKTPPKQ